MDLSQFQLVLGSKSPRRQELIKALSPSIQLKTKDTDESYPDSMDKQAVPRFLAEKKGLALQDELKEKEILVTSDTIVLLENEILGKPSNAHDALEMLKKLQGKTHLVISGVCILTKTKKHSFSVQTKVRFSQLTDEELVHYISNYNPLDKAGSYGIQDWIGIVGIESIEGCYYNVMGLPVSRLKKELTHFIQNL